VLIDLLARAGAESAAYHQSLDPFADAVFPVSWAGEERSANWFDTAREYTERWHHQQQIRLATDRTGIMTPALYHPVLDCFMRALPHAFRNLTHDAGTVLIVDVTGECGGRWFLMRDDGPADRSAAAVTKTEAGPSVRTSCGWRLAAAATLPATATIAIPQDIAWRVFTNGIERDEAARRVETTGDRELAMRVLETIAIVG
jgi:hypothetical protein